MDNATEVPRVGRRAGRRQQRGPAASRQDCHAEGRRADAMDNANENQQQVIERIKTVFRDCDTNDDNALSFQELYWLFQTLEPDWDEEQLWTLFCQVDQNGDEEIEFEEFIDFIFNEPHYLKSVLQAIDTCTGKIEDGDGELEYDEEYAYLHGLDVQAEFEDAEEEEEELNLTQDDMEVFIILMQNGCARDLQRMVRNGLKDNDYLIQKAKSHGINGDDLKKLEPWGQGLLTWSKGIKIHRADQFGSEALERVGKTAERVGTAIDSAKLVHSFVDFLGNDREHQATDIERMTGIVGKRIVNIGMKKAGEKVQASLTKKAIEAGGRRFACTALNAAGKELERQARSKLTSVGMGVMTSAGAAVAAIAAEKLGEGLGKLIGLNAHGQKVCSDVSGFFATVGIAAACGNAATPLGAAGAAAVAAVGWAAGKGVEVVAGLFGKVHKGCPCPSSGSVVLKYTYKNFFSDNWSKSKRWAENQVSKNPENYICEITHWAGNHFTTKVYITDPDEPMTFTWYGGDRNLVYNPDRYRSKDLIRGKFIQMGAEASLVAQKTCFTGLRETFTYVKVDEQIGMPIVFALQTSHGRFVMVVDGKVRVSHVYELEHTDWRHYFIEEIIDEERPNLILVRSLCEEEGRYYLELQGHSIGLWDKTQPRRGRGAPASVVFQVVPVGRVTGKEGAIALKIPE